jgi:hypothetical protein
MAEAMASRPAPRIREADVLATVVDYLHFRRGYVLKVHGHLGQRPGVPDLIACLGGRFVAIEVKAPCGRHPVSLRQQCELEAIRSAGGLALVATDVAEVAALLAAAALVPVADLAALMDEGEVPPTMMNVAGGGGAEGRW